MYIYHYFFIMIIIIDLFVDHPLSSAQCLVRIWMYHVQKAKSNLMLERS